MALAILIQLKICFAKTGQQNVQITASAESIAQANKLILPGVGSFDYGMQKLRKSGFYEVLCDRVLLDKVPVLGICLGAQLFTKGSEEGVEPGLGWLDATTVKFDKKIIDLGLKIPHMGWSNVTSVKSSSLFNDMYENPRFYFVHSYHIKCNQHEDKLVSAEHGNSFIAGFERNNLLGVQFHPEKSHKFGMKLLQNFALHF